MIIIIVITNPTPPPPVNRHHCPPFSYELFIVLARPVTPNYIFIFNFFFKSQNFDLIFIFFMLTQKYAKIKTKNKLINNKILYN